MISKEAVELFLERPRRDLRGYKKLTNDKLTDLVEGLPVQPPMWRQLRKHQRVGFILGARFRRLALFLDTGCGKTIITIALARYFRKAKVAKRFLVLVRSRVNKTEWEEEILKHAPNMSYRILSGTSKEKWVSVEEGDPVTMTIETLGGLTRMLSLPGKNKRGKTVLKPSAPLMKRLRDHFDGIVVDESQNIGNHMAIQTRLCRALAKELDVVLLLTATPFGRDPQILWPQINMVDGGHTLGQTLELFRTALFNQTKNNWGGIEWKFNKKNNGLLHRMLAHCSVTYEADEADLPRVVPIAKYINLPEEANTYYQRAKQTIIEAKGNYRELKNSFLRMRQISSGFVGFKNDETGDKAEFEFSENPKLEMLMSVLLGLAPHEKVIIFHDFYWSAQRIAKELTKEKISYAMINGKARDVENARRKFVNDNDCQVLLLSNEMAAGLNVQVAQYGLYYESPLSAITRKQTQRRVERQGSLFKHVFIYDFLVRGTVDELIRNAHKEGYELLAAIIGGKVRV